MSYRESLSTSVLFNESDRVSKCRQKVEEHTNRFSPRGPDSQLLIYLTGGGKVFLSTRFSSSRGIPDASSQADVP